MGAVLDRTDRAYPRTLLEGVTTALAGFCAAFLGRQDCVWLADAGVHTICVDVDEDRLREMRPLYPRDWVFLVDDIYGYAASQAAYGREFDLVTLDPPTNQFDRVAHRLPLWCSLARSLVIVGTPGYVVGDQPKGWQITDHIRRSDFAGGVYWTVLEPA